MKTWFHIAGVLIIAAGCGPHRIPIPDDALVVLNGTVIDGTGTPPMVDGAVVVQEGRIVAVGEASSYQIPGTARVIDAGGGTILPGVINSHTHSTHEAAVRRAFLTDGVTTVCNLGTSLDRLSMFNDASTPEGPAARAYWAGPIITAPGGYPGPVYGSRFAYEVGSPEEARGAVSDLLDRGADVIKIALAPGNPRDPWPVLDRASVEAIVDAAHSRGVLVRAHVFEPYLIEDIVLPAGVDVIEHQSLPILSPEEERRVLDSDQPRTLLFDSIAPEYERLLAKLVERGIAMVPTLDGGIGTLFKKTGRSRVEEIVVDVNVEATRRFHARGGNIALGNDYGGVPNVEAGMPLAEMELLRAAGLPPMEVVVASTYHAAQVCGKGSELGSLEAGKLADIIVVDGDPLADLTAMARVIAVIKGGEVAYEDRIERS